MSSVHFSASDNKALWFGALYTEAPQHAVHVITEMSNHCKMIERVGHGEVGSILVITSLIEPETAVKASICMQGSSQLLRNKQ